jgi:N-glycosylase/DNA lyase
MRSVVGPEDSNRVQPEKFGTGGRLGRVVFPVVEYDLGATLDSGQVFGWEQHAGGWSGVVQGRWVALRDGAEGIAAETVAPGPDWDWLKCFLQTEVQLTEILATFPRADARLQRAVTRWRGLRLLRQDPWECLASFILSSTKQIVQIRQIVRLLRERFGERVLTPPGAAPAYAFPPAERLAGASEAELRDCKMGFRAPYLRAAAQRVAAGEIDLGRLGQLELAAARTELLRFAGVGEKIADCVLLFAYGFPTAFPIDVWVQRVLTREYFRGRNVSVERLRMFSARHFGPHAGYAQQYLFHHERTGEQL